MPRKLPIQAQTDSAATVAVGHGLELDHRHPSPRRMQQRRGGLFPEYGDEEIHQRLDALLKEHSPRTLVLLGDIVDGGAAPEPGLELLERLATRPGLELIVIRGNHDRALVRLLADKPEWNLRPCWRLEDCVFHHGHASGREAAWPLLLESGGAGLEISGHVHPAAVLKDGAGTWLKLPALWYHAGGAGRVSDGSDRSDLTAEPAWPRYVLPAFSPWASGVTQESRWRGLHPLPDAVWVCAPGRAFALPRQMRGG